MVARRVVERRIRDGRRGVGALRGAAPAKLVHSVGVPVGGSRLADARQLAVLREAVTSLQAPWCSEHLSFNVAAGKAGTFVTGFLLPPRTTWAGVDAAVTSVSRFADAMGAPVAIETGVSYLKPRGDELRDAQFVAAVAEVADCGILLDLHNLWTNERNGRQTVDSYLAELPLERVWELHLAGGQEHAGFWLDAHSGAIPERILEIAAAVVPQLPRLGAIIFELMPEQISRLGVPGLRQQLVAMREIWMMRPAAANGWRAPTWPPWSAAATATVDAQPRISPPPDPQMWEDTLGALAVGLTAEGQLCAELADDPGLGIIRDLVCEARAGMLAASLRLTLRLLLLSLGEAEVRSLLSRFWEGTTPNAFAATEALAFGTFLRERSPNVRFLEDVLAFEIAVIRAVVAGDTTTLHFHSDPDELLGALADGCVPRTVTGGDYPVEISVGT